MGSRSGSTTTANVPSVPESQTASKGPAIFSYTCVGLTGVALVAVVVFYCNRHVRSRAPVTAAGEADGGGGGGGGGREDARGVADVASKIPEFAYAGSARHSGRWGCGEGAQCSVCLGAVQAGEMVRLLPACKHMYHVECIDMWLASHATCPFCRTEVEPPPGPGDDGPQQPAPADQPPTQSLPPV